MKWILALIWCSFIFITIPQGRFIMMLGILSAYYELYKEYGKSYEQKHRPIK